MHVDTKNDSGVSACCDCDRTACTHAAAQRGTYVYRCHAGLTEAVTSLYVGDILVGYLLFGHLFAYPSFEEGWNTVRNACEKYGGDLEELKQCCRQLEEIREDYILAASRILQAVASFLVMERMAVLQTDSLSAQLDAYLSEHFAEKLDIPKLCSLLQIGRSQLYQLSKRMYGCGLLCHVRKLRLKQACLLLADHSELSIAEIALACGFRDYNYFIATFSREVGKPPRAYRESMQGALRGGMDGGALVSS